MADAQLEIIGPNGDVRFHSLDDGGLVNIGRDPENDIVINSPSVAPFHAVLDARQQPYQLVVLAQGYPTRVAGRLIEQSGSEALQTWDTVELDGYSLILLEGAGAVAPSRAAVPAMAGVGATAAVAGAAMSAPVMGEAAQAFIERRLPRAPIGAMSEAPFPEYRPLPDQSDEFVVIEMDPREFITDVDLPINFNVDVTNGGDLVASFYLQVDGVPPEWVTVAPDFVNLREGQHRSFAVTITPPRDPGTLAGTHSFGVVVYSPEFPGRFARRGAALVINPYYDFSIGDVSPKRQRIGYFKRVGKASFPVMNRGNSDLGVQLNGEDDERAVQFEFKLAGDDSASSSNVTVLGPSEALDMSVVIAPNRRRFIGLGGHAHNFTITATPLSGFATPLSVAGRAVSTPLIGPIWIVLALLLLTVLTVWLLRPQVYEFTVTPGQVDSGKTATLEWRAAPFATLRIDPDIGVLDRSEGTIEIEPRFDTTYRITAENLLTRLNQSLFFDDREATVLVDPRLPSIRFFVDRVNVNVGETVTLSWEVGRAARVLLIRNGIPETIPVAQHTGSRTFTVEESTTFELRAFNDYTDEDLGVAANIQVTASTPQPTAAPPAVIQRFDVVPSRIQAGDIITISWAVEDVDSVNIAPIGDLPPTGTLNQAPTTTTTYVLQAVNESGQPVSLFREVVVDPAPTPTPLPGTPVIEFFQATPNEVALGSNESQSVTLSWSIQGDITGVSISAIGFNVSGLPAVGQRVVTVSQRTLFILTATNQSLNASTTAEVKVNNPVPTVSSLSPASSTDVGGARFTMTIFGTGFVPQSRVRWNGQDRPTTFISSTQLQASIFAEDIQSSGEFPVTVFNPVPGGGNSAPVNFRLDNPTPVIGDVSPPQVEVGNPGINITVTGTGFTPESQVQWAGTNLDNVVYVNANQLTAPIGASRLAAAAVVPITVVNQGVNGSLVSNTVNFSVSLTSLTPQIDAIAPGSFKTNTVPFTITITGSNFANGAQVRWQGVNLTTVTVISDQVISAQVDNTVDTSVAGTVFVTVVNPGGTISNAYAFTLTDDALDGWSPACVTSGAVQFTLQVDLKDPTAGPVTATWNGVPVTATILPAPNNDRVNLTIPALLITGPGAAIVEITVGTRTSSFSLDVRNPQAVLTPTILPAQVVVGTSLAVQAQLQPAPGCLSPHQQTGTRTVGLVSSDAAVIGVSLLGVPVVSVNVPAGGTVNFDVDGVAIPSSPAVASVTPTVNGAEQPTQQVQVSVINPAVTLGSVAPTTRVWGGAVFTLTVNGSGFVNNASGTTQVFWNGTPLGGVTVVNANQLTVSVPSAQLTNKSQANPVVIQVTNPVPSANPPSANLAGVTLADPVLSFTNVTDIAPSGTITANVNISAALGAPLDVCVSVTGGVTLTAPLGTGPCAPGQKQVTIAAGATTATFDITAGVTPGAYTVSAAAALGTTPVTNLVANGAGNIAGRTVTFNITNVNTGMQVVSSPAGMNCTLVADGTCTGSFPTGGTVDFAFTATPYGGGDTRNAATVASFTFVSGEACLLGGGSCRINTLNTNTVYNMALVTQHRVSVGAGNTSNAGVDYVISGTLTDNDTINCTIANGTGAATGDCEAWATPGAFGLDISGGLEALPTARDSVTWGGGLAACGTDLEANLPCNFSVVAAGISFTTAFQQQYLLTIAGAGTNDTAQNITGGGLNCNITNGATAGTCAVWVNAGTNVLVTRPNPIPGNTPTAQALFNGWSIGACGTNVTCNVTMNVGQTVTLTYQQQYLLTIAGAGTNAVAQNITGGGGLSCDITNGATAGTCTVWVNDGAVYTITRPNPVSGNTADQQALFSGWSVGACGVAGTCNVTLTVAPLTVTLTYQQQYRVRVLNGANAGAPVLMTSAPAGITCTNTAGTVAPAATCETWVNVGTNLTITAGRAPTAWNRTGTAGGACLAATTCVSTGIASLITVAPAFP